MATKLPKVQITPPINARVCISLIELLAKIKINPPKVPIKLMMKPIKYNFITINFLPCC